MEIEKYYKRKIKFLINDKMYKEYEKKVNDIISNIIDDIYINKNIKSLYKREENHFYFSRYNDIKNDFILNNFLYLLDSGGYGLVFRCDSNYCMKVILNYKNLNLTHEYHIPKTIYKELKKNNFLAFTSFLNVPDLLLENKKCINLKLLIVIYTFLLLTIKNIIDKTIDIEKLSDLNSQLNDFNNLGDIFVKYKKNKDFYILFTNLYYRYLHNFTDTVLLNNFKSLMKFFGNYKSKYKKNLKTNTLDCSLLFVKLALSTSDKLLLDNNLEVSNHGNKAYDVDNSYLRLLTLQTFLFILAVNKCYNYFVHNDLKLNNILVFNNNKIINIKYNKKLITFKEKYLFKINDFDFANFDGYENKKISDSVIKKNNHWLYDVYNFINSLESFITIEKLNKIDLDLYKSLKTYFHYDHNNRDTIKNRFDISHLETFLLEDKLFNKWITNQS